MTAPQTGPSPDIIRTDSDPHANGDFMTNEVGDVVSADPDQMPPLYHIKPADMSDYNPPGAKGTPEVTPVAPKSTELGMGQIALTDAEKAEVPTPEPTPSTPAYNPRPVNEGDPVFEHASPRSLRVQPLPASRQSGMSAFITNQTAKHGGKPVTSQ